jgi:hypothetical protein
LRGDVGRCGLVDAKPLKRDPRFSRVLGNADQLTE